MDGWTARDRDALSFTSGQLRGKGPLAPPDFKIIQEIVGPFLCLFGRLARELQHDDNVVRCVQKGQQIVPSREFSVAILTFRDSEPLSASSPEIRLQPVHP